MAKISKVGGPTVKGSQEPVDLNTVVTLGLLSQILDYLEVAVWVEGPGGNRLGIGSNNVPGPGTWLGRYKNGD